MQSVTWDDDLLDGLDFLATHVLQLPLFLMTMMRHITPALDNMWAISALYLWLEAHIWHRFMDSLQWVDYTYNLKHKSEDQSQLRDMYYPNLRLYSTRDGSTHSKSTAEAFSMVLMRFGKKAVISLVIFGLSYIPYIGRFVLPAASFYTFNKAVGLGPAAIIFGTGLFLPKRYLVIFLQSYFSSRSLMRELVSVFSMICDSGCWRLFSWSHTFPEFILPRSKRNTGSTTERVFCLALPLDFTYSSGYLCLAY